RRSKCGHVCRDLRPPRIGLARRREGQSEICAGTILRPVSRFETDRRRSVAAVFQKGSRRSGGIGGRNDTTEGEGFRVWAGPLGKSYRGANDAGEVNGSKNSWR